MAGDGKIIKTDADWKKELTPEQYQVMREKGTEPAFTGKYYKTKDRGTYLCAACGNELFSSDSKFDSGTGWPSFTEPKNLENIELSAEGGSASGGKEDLSHGITRTEVLCKKCGGHLGHVFDDLPAQAGGPREKGGKRFCINSCALNLKNEASVK